MLQRGHVYLASWVVHTRQTRARDALVTVGPSHSSGAAETWTEGFTRVRSEPKRMGTRSMMDVASEWINGLISTNQSVLSVAISLHVVSPFWWSTVSPGRLEGAVPDCEPALASVDDGEARVKA